jgi:hypothetical protein
MNSILNIESKKRKSSALTAGLFLLLEETMRPECSHILPSGQNCHCLALRGRKFCRHHSPEALPPPPPPSESISRLARWRGLGRTVDRLPAADIPFNVYIILGSLIGDGEDGISDREAGRLLRVLLRRHGSIPFPPPTGCYIEPETTPAPAPATVAAPARRPMSVDSLPAEVRQMFDPKLLDQMLASFKPNGRIP